MPKSVVTKRAAASVAAILLTISVTAAQAERPVALVESITDAPEAEFSAFDYVYRKDKIDLRPGGVVMLSYFDTCVVETVRGGVVKLTEDSAKISKGGQSSKSQRPCQSGQLVVTAEMAEAGAAIKRLSPFESGRWREWTVKDRPTLQMGPAKTRRRTNDRADRFCGCGSGYDPLARPSQRRLFEVSR